MTQSNILTSTAQPVTLRVPDFQRVYLTLVGCGGTGSHIASGLVAIAQALRDKSISIEMLFIDPDRVEPKNVGRQLFSSGDIGEAKAEALAGRLNAAFGERIMSAVRGIDALDLVTGEHTGSPQHAVHIVIGAVDNAAARAVIADVVKSEQGALWWLDCGNENHSGQICLGNAGAPGYMRNAIALGLVDRLPAPSVVYPDLIGKKGKKETRKQGRRGASCAELTAAGEQGLMVNRLVAGFALSMLYDFVVARSLKYFAVAFDQVWGGVRTYAIDAPTIAEVCGLKAGDVMVKASKR
jgi:PRTRC genetic system ThiF family protein